MTPKSSRLSVHGLLLVVLALITGCSSTKSVATDDVTDEMTPGDGDSTAPAFVWVDSTRAVLKTASGVESNYIGPGGHVLFTAGSPDDSAIVYAVENSGRVELTYVDMNRGATSSLQVARSPVVFTGAFSPDSRSFAFGFYTPVDGQGRNTIGEGTIKIYSTADGQIQPVGCSASQAVVAWPAAGRLMVRNNDSMYGVNPADCETQVTIDIRKWYHLTPSPDGMKLAYILRDLAFNSDTRSYEPDSMLYVVDTGAAEGKLVVGDRYRPRNVAWSSDSKEIAFDVLERIDAEKRVVFIYQLEEDRRFVLNNPSERSPSESHPMYLHGSNALTYVADNQRLMIRGGNLMVEQVSVGSSAGDWLRLTGFLPDDRLAFITDSSGAVHVYSTRTKTSHSLGNGVTVVPGGQLR